jgi:hypothetical protein
MLNSRSQIESICENPQKITINQSIFFKSLLYSLNFDYLCAIFAHLYVCCAEQFVNDMANVKNAGIMSMDYNSIGVSADSDVIDNNK